MSESFAEHPERWCRKKESKVPDWESVMGGLPTVVLPISSLLLGGSPRKGGACDKHVRLLAESEEQLPPIVVCGRSMRVIDGIHRVYAAIMRGKEEIEAKVYPDTEDDVFVLAVQMNIAHGLPLTRADRMAAAARIIGLHPEWSNRMIATVTGLSAGTIGKVRQGSTVQNARSTTRVGKDGRVRPIDSTASRQKVSELLAEKPTASSRAIAKEAGVSPSTVQDVRQRLRVSQNPILERRRAQQPIDDALAASRPPFQRNPGNPESADVDTTAILANLKRDPSLRFCDEGRPLLRWLDRHRVGMTVCRKVAEMIPEHCADLVAKLGRLYARVWTKLAEYLEECRPSSLGGHQHSGAAQIHARGVYRLVCECRADVTRSKIMPNLAGVERSVSNHGLIVANQISGLSSAEQRVALLAAEGYTNREVAKKLFITVSTVEQHITRIYRKLGVSRRAELATVLNVTSCSAMESYPSTSISR
jgi:DNA-binding CsgD family transcriptional regulator